MNHDPLHKSGASENEHGDVAAYVLDELNATERAAFEAHVASCASCRAALAKRQETHALLHTIESATVSHDLAPEILDRIRAGRSESWWRTASLAALLLIGTVLGLWWWPNAGSKSVPVVSGVDLLDDDFVASTRCEDALQWLCRAQEPDGSWDPEKWGGDRRYRVALTTLSAMALLDHPSPSAAMENALSKAVLYLVDQQGQREIDSTGFSDRKLAALAIEKAGYPLGQDRWTSGEQGGWAYGESRHDDQPLEEVRYALLQSPASVGIERGGQIYTTAMACLTR